MDGGLSFSGVIVVGFGPMGMRMWSVVRGVKEHFLTLGLCMCVCMYVVY